MQKKIISTLSVLSFLAIGSITPINAIEKPATWLKVTADGIPGSAPSPNKINAKGKDTKISKKKCKKNTGKALGAIAGGFFGAQRGNTSKSKVAGAVIGATAGAGVGRAVDGC